MSMQQNIETARTFLAALEQFDSAALSRLVSPDAQRIEFPNKLKPAGATQNAREMLADAGRARTLLRSQTYRVRNIATADGLVLMELVWTATLAMDVAPCRREMSCAPIVQSPLTSQTA